MNNFDLLISLSGIIAIVFLLFIHQQSSDVPELTDTGSDLILHEDIQMLLAQNSALAKNEAEQRARYNEIKNKYRDAFTACGYRFPQYNGR